MLFSVFLSHRHKCGGPQDGMMGIQQAKTVQHQQWKTMCLLCGKQYPNLNKMLFCEEISCSGWEKFKLTLTATDGIRRLCCFLIFVVIIIFSSSQVELIHHEDDDFALADQIYVVAITDVVQPAAPGWRRRQAQPGWYGGNVLGQDLTTSAAHWITATKRHGSKQSAYTHRTLS